MLRRRALTDMSRIVCCIADWEIGMRESGGPEMAAFGDLL